MIPQPDFSRLPEVLTRLQGDPAFLNALQQDTAGALQALGIAFPVWLQLHAVENGQPLFVLRQPQTSSELSDKDLDGVAGGWVDFSDDDPFAKSERGWPGA